MTGNKNLEEIIPIYIERFKQNYDELEERKGRHGKKGSEIIKWLKDEVQSAFSKDNIDSLDKEKATAILAEFYSINYGGVPGGIEKKENKEWVEKIYEQNFAEKLKDLLFGEDDISERYFRFKAINGVNNGIVSEILSYFYPDKYSFYSSSSQRALVYLGFDFFEVPVIGKKAGRNYIEYCEKVGQVLNILRKDSFFKDADFTTVDYFLSEVGKAKIWKIAPGSGAHLWYEGYCQKNEQICIGWNDVSNKLKEDILTADYDTILKKCQSVYSDHSLQSVKTIVKQITDFLHEIQVGDIVVVNQGKTAILGYGTVRSGPNYLNDDENEYPLYRDVFWQETDLNIPIPKDSGLIGKCNKTIANLSFDQFRNNVLDRMSDRKYWVMNPSYSNGKSIFGLYFWNRWIEGNYIHLESWKDFLEKYGEEALNFSDYTEFENNYNKVYDDNSIANYLYKYLFSLNEGDIVIINDGKKRIVGKGILSSETYYDNEPEKSYYHDVNWEKTDLNIPIPNDLKGKFSKRVAELTKDEYERIMNAMTNNEENVDLAMLDLLLERKKQVILYGPPGTGKTYRAKQFIDAHSNNSSDSEASSENNISNTRFVTFHPSFAYEDFIEGLRPETDKDGCIHYRIQDGVFKEFARDSFNALLKKAGIEKEWMISGDIPELSEDECMSALEIVPEVPFYLTIDEINRGDISRIFGELITLLEADKRLCNKNRLATTLPYSKTRFGIPPNLFIIGTMNTADKSIALVDIALRRRFGFLEMMPDSDVLKRLLASDDARMQEIFDTAIAVYEHINNSILEKYDRDHQIGHSYFVKLKEDVTPEEACESLEFIWYSEVLPLLQEYFYDSPKKLFEILGKDFVTLCSDERSFMFTEPCRNDVFLYALKKLAKMEISSGRDEEDIEEDYSSQDN